LSLFALFRFTNISDSRLSPRRDAKANTEANQLFAKNH
jgi:hypothetical protein